MITLIHSSLLQRISPNVFAVYADRSDALLPIEVGVLSVIYGVIIPYERMLVHPYDRGTVSEYALAVDTLSRMECYNVTFVERIEEKLRRSRILIISQVD